MGNLPKSSNLNSQGSITKYIYISGYVFGEKKREENSEIWKESSYQGRRGGFWRGRPEEGISKTEAPKLSSHSLQLLGRRNEGDAKKREGLLSKWRGEEEMRFFWCIRQAWKVLHAPMTFYRFQNVSRVVPRVFWALHTSKYGQILKRASHMHSRAQ